MGFFYFLYKAKHLFIMNNKIKLTPSGSLQRHIRLYGKYCVSHPWRVLSYMKKLIFIALLIILAIAHSYAQMKQDNCIVVKGASFNEVIQTAVDAHLVPLKIDTVFHYAEIELLNDQIMYITQNKCGDINLMSDFNAPWFGRTVKIQVLWYKNSFSRKRWDLVQAFANKFDHIEYARL